MHSSQLPAGFLDRFNTPGSTVQVTNMMNPMVDREEQFVQEGEVERVWIENETLKARFAWLAQKDVSAGTWNLVDDPAQLSFELSLELCASGHAPDDGRFLFMPMEPIVHEQVLLLAADYHGSTGRRPLSRSEVVPA